MQDLHVYESCDSINETTNWNLDHKALIVAAKISSPAPQSLLHPQSQPGAIDRQCRFSEKQF